MHCCVTTSVRPQPTMESLRLILEMFQLKCLVLQCITSTLILCRQVFWLYSIPVCSKTVVFRSQHISADAQKLLPAILDKTDCAYPPNVIAVYKPTFHHKMYKTYKLMSCSSHSVCIQVALTVGHMWRNKIESGGSEYEWIHSALRIYRRQDDWVC